MDDLIELMMQTAQGDEQCGAEYLDRSRGWFYCMLEFGHEGCHIAVRDNEPLPFDWPPIDWFPI